MSKINVATDRLNTVNYSNFCTKEYENLKNNNKEKTFNKPS